MLESANGCVLPSTDVVRPVNEIICREKRTIFRSPWNVHVQCNNIWFTCSQEPPLVFSERVEKVLQVPFKIFIGNESCWGDIITVTWRTWNIWCIGNGHVIIMRWKAPKWEHSDVEQKKKLLVRSAVRNRTMPDKENVCLLQWGVKWELFGGLVKIHPECP